MTIEISCTCGKEYKVGADLLGKKVKCKACGKPIEVEISMAPPEPTPEEEPSAPKAPRKRGKTGKTKVGKPKTGKTGKTKTGKTSKPKTGTGKRRRPPAKKQGSAPLILGGVGVVALLLLGAGGYFMFAGDSGKPPAATEAPTSSVAATPAQADAEPKDPSGWIHWKPEEGGFKLLLPATPKLREQEFESSMGSLDQHVAEVETDGGKVVYQVYFWDYKFREVPQFETFKEVVETLSNRLPEDDRRGLTETEIKHEQGSPGRELRVTTTVGEKKMSRVTVLYLVQKKRMIQLTVVAQEGSAKPELVKRFVDSLEILEQ